MKSKEKALEKYKNQKMVNHEVYPVEELKKRKNDPYRKLSMEIIK